MADEERKGDGEEEEEEEGEKSLLDDVGLLDFDILCTTVASRAQGFSLERMGKGEGEEEREGEEVGGVQRMWEGGVFDCLEDRRIAIEAACCPCYRFGKNMERANLGGRLLQGSVYVILVVAALSNFVLFGVTRWFCFLYIGAAFVLSLGIYLGYFRSRIRKLFNIRGRSGSFDDCMHHLCCSGCSLCQEARTLEMNNVQAGIWHGRGDTICIGSSAEASKSFPISCQPQLTKSPSPDVMQRDAPLNDHKWSVASGHSQPLVPSTTSESPVL